MKMPINRLERAEKAMFPIRQPVSYVFDHGDQEAVERALKGNPNSVIVRWLRPDELGDYKDPTLTGGVQ